MNERDFESQLRVALARQDPSAGFAERVAARARAAAAPRPKRRPWVSLALAATLLLTFSAVGWQRAREARRAEETKQQLMLALRITSQKLAVIERVLERSAN